MLGDEYEKLLNDVGQVGESDNYHFLTEGGNTLETMFRAVCGAEQTFHTYNKVERMSIDEAIEEGLGFCGNCADMLQKTYGIEVKECALCNRPNVAVEVNYTTVNIPYKVGDEEESHICQNCKLTLNGVF